MPCQFLLMTKDMQVTRCGVVFVYYFSRPAREDCPKSRDLGRKTHLVGDQHVIYKLPLAG